MKLNLALAVLACGLAGCQNNVPLEQLSYSQQKAVAAQAVQRCQAQGVKLGTQEMATCGTIELNRDKAIRARRAAAADSSVVCNKVFETVICN